MKTRNRNYTYIVCLSNCAHKKHPLVKKKKLILKKYTFNHVLRNCQWHVMKILKLMCLGLLNFSTGDKSYEHF